MTQVLRRKVVRVNIGGAERQTHDARSLPEGTSAGRAGCGCSRPAAPQAQSRAGCAACSSGRPADQRGARGPQACRGRADTDAEVHDPVDVHVQREQGTFQVRVSARKRRARRSRAAGGPPRGSGRSPRRALGGGGTTRRGRVRGAPARELCPARARFAVAGLLAAAAELQPRSPERRAGSEAADAEGGSDSPPARRRDRPSGAPPGSRRTTALVTVFAPPKLSMARRRTRRAAGVLRQVRAAACRAEDVCDPRGTKTLVAATRMVAPASRMAGPSPPGRRHRDLHGEEPQRRAPVVDHEVSDAVQRLPPVRATRPAPGYRGSCAPVRSSTLLRERAVVEPGRVRPRAHLSARRQARERHQGAASAEMRERARITSRRSVGTSRLRR